MAYLDHTPGVAVVLLRMLARRLVEADRKLVEFVAQDTVGRVCARLVDLAERFGEPAPGRRPAPRPGDPGGARRLDRGVARGAGQGAAGPARAGLDRDGAGRDHGARRPGAAPARGPGPLGGLPGAAGGVIPPGRCRYAAAGGPNQVVSASASPGSVPSPTQAT